MEAAIEAQRDEETQGEEQEEEQVANAFARQIDLIEHRYSGWTDEYVKKIPFLRFEEIIETIVEARYNEEKQRLKEVAYGQWCAYTLRFIVREGSKHMSFKKFCNVMGLGDKKVKPQWDEKTTEEISAATARIKERHDRSLQDRSEDPDQRKGGDS